MKGYNTLYDHKVKVASAISAGVFAAITVVQRFTHFTITPKLDATQHYYMSLAFTVFSLMLMGYSKERNDDERVKQIRARSLQIMYFLFSGILLSLVFTAIADKEMVFTAPMLLFLSSFNIIFYLIIFHIGIYFDQVWDYSDEIGIWENMRKNWGYILVLSVCSIVLISAIFTLFITEG